MSCRHGYRKGSLENIKKLSDTDTRYGNNEEKGKIGNSCLKNLFFVSLDYLFTFTIDHLTVEMGTGSKGHLSVFKARRYPISVFLLIVMGHF